MHHFVAREKCPQALMEYQAPEIQVIILEFGNEPN